MAGRRRPEVVSTRVTIEEKAVIAAAASCTGQPVSEFIHGVLVPAAWQVVAVTMGQYQAQPVTQAKATDEHA